MTDDQTDRPDLLAGLRNGSWLDAQKFPPLEYAIPGLIPEGFTLLIGPPKAGKSWLALDFLLSASAGGYALGHIKTGPARPVLYLALEDGHRRMQDRCRTLLGEGQEIPRPYHYLTRIHPGTVLATLEAFLADQPDTALIIVDTLGKVMPPAEQGESAYQRDYRVGGALKKVADDRPGLALVVLHHDRKATAEDFVDSVSGTHGLAGAADTIVVLARQRQSTDGLLKITGRDVVEAEYALTMDDGQWTLDGSTLVEASHRAASRAETEQLGDRSVAIIDFVRQHPEGVKPADVAERFGTDATTARVYLSRAVDAGRLARAKRGTYTPVTSVTSVTSEGGQPPERNTRNARNTPLGADGSARDSDAVPGQRAAPGTLGADPDPDDDSGTWSA